MSVHTAAHLIYFQHKHNSWAAWHTVQVNYIQKDGSLISCEYVGELSLASNSWFNHPFYQIKNDLPIHQGQQMARDHSTMVEAGGK
jgi:hypothetical protein